MKANMRRNLRPWPILAGILVDNAGTALVVVGYLVVRVGAQVAMYGFPGIEEISFTTTDSIVMGTLASYPSF